MKSYILLALLFCSGPYAASKYYKLNYVVPKKTSLNKVIRKFLKKRSYKIKKSHFFVKKIKKSNKHVKKWSRLRRGTKIKLYIPKKIGSKKKIRKYLKRKKQRKRRKVKKRKKKEEEVKFNFVSEEKSSTDKQKKNYVLDIDASYRMSSTTASEQDSSINSDLDAELLSLFGLNTHLALFNKAQKSPLKYILGLEFYKSASGQGSLPLEWCLDFKVMKSHWFDKLSFSLGLEMQRRSNLSLLSDSSLQSRKSSFIWIDLGVIYDYKWREHTISVGGSFAKSISGSTELATGSTAVDLSGTRYGLYGQFAYKSKYFLRWGLKSSSLDGTIDITYTDYEGYAGIKFDLVSAPSFIKKILGEK